MYAIFQIGSKQHKASIGDILHIEKINATVGEIIDFNQIMMIFDYDTNTIQLGDPYLKERTIRAEVLFHGRKKKIIVLKFRRRKHYRKRQGHRQWFTTIKITHIN
ncbi:50S ribosomal protein L21 [Candidatus Schneideria nysicola]|uniref:50S ribosomal protein L21 n=1 Tax=Candidatus Schneideria nysicola TaxID=1081631 RepID=UPI001CAA7A3D|nr:50S ribosomal protein L21 [Candidatus Schneideria nysicola]UAJ65865.1 50S ribosomal protein L21 [Candidatus Schneideria nysicola]